MRSSSEYIYLSFSYGIVVFFGDDLILSMIHFGVACNSGFNLLGPVVLRLILHIMELRVLFIFV